MDEFMSQLEKRRADRLMRLAALKGTKVNSVSVELDSDIQQDSLSLGEPREKMDKLRSYERGDCEILSGGDELALGKTSSCRFDSINRTQITRDKTEDEDLYSSDDMKEEKRVPQSDLDASDCDDMSLHLKDQTKHDKYSHGCCIETGSLSKFDEINNTTADRLVADSQPILCAEPIQEVHVSVSQADVQKDFDVNASDSDCNKSTFRLISPTINKTGYEDVYKTDHNEQEVHVSQSDDDDENLDVYASDSDCDKATFRPISPTPAEAPTGVFNHEQSKANSVSENYGSVKNVVLVPTSNSLAHSCVENVRDRPILEKNSVQQAEQQSDICSDHTDSDPLVVVGVLKCDGHPIQANFNAANRLIEKEKERGNLPVTAGLDADAVSQRVSNTEVLENNADEVNCSVQAIEPDLYSKRKSREKKKGLGGLSAEKKKLLKKLIMDMAMEELRREEEEKRLAKQKYLDERVGTLDMDGLNLRELTELAKEIHEKIARAEEEKYDWEVKSRRQDFEINQLTIQVNDIRGKFVKPVLRKVSTTDSKLQKLQEYRKKRAEMKAKMQAEEEEEEE